jgi:hypothetical protein
VGGTTFLLVLPEHEAAVAMVGNMSQAPTGYVPSLIILEAFLASEQLAAEAEGTGPNLSGAYRCSGEFRGESIGTGELDLRGDPSDYWGRIVWGNETTDRIIYASSSASETRLISVDERGRLTDTRLHAEGEGVAGTWFSGGRRGSLMCQKP